MVKILFLSAITTVILTFLGVPVVFASTFSFTVGLFVFINHIQKKKQLTFLVDRIEEEYLLRLERVKSKTNNEKELKNMEEESLIEIFNSIFGVRENNMDIIDIILSDILCFDIHKYIINEKKFSYYYNSEYLEENC